MGDVTDILRRAPFGLDDAGVDWVRRVKAGLSDRQKLGQLFILLSIGRDPDELARLEKLQPAGITRMFSPDRDFECDFMDRARGTAKVPMLISADLEGSRMSLAFGTEVPNPLALAAVDDVQASRTVARIMAEEARAMGINWSFTPVLDINAAFRSPIVATRGFGSDVARIERQALAQIDAFQAAGVAATVKHWPGEGFDDRDQHLVTTINPLSMAEWEAQFGRLYRAAIEAGVMSVMSAHIALPAFVQASDPAAGVEAYRPASVSRALNLDLLRGRLGFNGVIVSDATGMAGFGAWGPRDAMLPEVIANGCDLILFTHDTEEDMERVAAAIADGRISAARLDEALTRVLGLKAALGLQHGFASAVAQKAALGTAENRAAARAVTARAPTLVKDVAGLLPLSPARHRRVLVVSGGIISPIHPEPAPFHLPDMLRAEGFEVTMFTPGMPVTRQDFDLMIYLFGEETLLTRGRIFLDWARIGGNFHAAMERHWHEIPTLMISFGYPYYLYDAPRMPAYVNTYATMPSMQAAVVDCLMGRADWNRTSPVDAFCGLPDARY
jgi:beta-N-acetylhexosaminidase